MTYTVLNSPFKTVNSKRRFQVKEVLETSIGPEPRDWRFLFINFVLYTILPDDPNKVTAIKRKPPRLYYNEITQSLYHRTYDVILLCCHSHKEAQEALRKAYDDACGAHQLDSNLGIVYKDLSITGQRWFLTLLPTLGGVTLVRFRVTSYIKHQFIFTQCLFHGHLRCEKWMLLGPSAH